MDSRCGACKFWGDPNKDHPDDLVKTCTAIRHRSPANSWDFDLETYEEEIAAARAKNAECIASTLDGSNYMSCLRVRDDFGCVLFEPGLEGGKNG